MVRLERPHTKEDALSKVKWNREHPEAAACEALALQFEQSFGSAPKLAMVLGSGLGGVVDALENPTSVPYPDLGLPGSKVVGHAGVMHVGTVGQERIALGAGRVHLYEGWHPYEVVRMVRAWALWGVESIILTNAAGSLHEAWKPGRLVRMTDHLNMLGVSPLTGPPFGQRFPDVSEAYDKNLGALIDHAAKELGIPLEHGVYAATPGPQYETKAEIRMFGVMGADLVGMSTVPEVIAAFDLGMQVAAISAVTNLANGVGNEPVDHAAVTSAGAIAAKDLVRLLVRVAEQAS